MKNGRTLKILCGQKSGKEEHDASHRMSTHDESSFALLSAHVTERARADDSMSASERVREDGENPFADPGHVARYEEWYRHAGVQADRREKAVLKKLLQGFPEGRTLLEVGCGTGHFTRWFEAQGLSAVGVDLSEPMLAEARRHGSRRCVRASASALPFDARQFDLVALIATLEFLAQPARALREAVRVTRRGVLLGTFNRWSLYALRRRLRSSPVWSRARFFTLFEVRRLLAEAAGERRSDMTWWSTSWSLPSHGRPRAVPCGDFIGWAMTLTPGE